MRSAPGYRASGQLQWENPPGGTPEEGVSGSPLVAGRARSTPTTAIRDNYGSARFPLAISIGQQTIGTSVATTQGPRGERACARFFLR